jgi:lysophospholipase L1-like esterase
MIPKFLKPFFLCPLLGLASGPIVFCADQAIATLPAEVKRVVFLGDSITYAGDYAIDIETYFLTRHPGREIEFINVGLKSETVSGLSEEGHAKGNYARPDLHDRLDRVLSALRPDLVFACYGMNDGIYRPFDQERFQAYREGVAKLEASTRAAGARIIFLTPPVYDGRTRGKAFYEDVLLCYSAWLFDQRETIGWEVVDVHGPMVQRLRAGIAQDPGFALARDGVHPLEYGHWLIARAVLRYLGAGDLNGVESAEAMAAVHPAGREILKRARRRSDVLRDAWLTAIGHNRPMKPGLPLEEARPIADEIGQEIAALRNAWR